MTKNQEPWILIEVKSSDKMMSKNLKYFNAQIKSPYAFQVLNEMNYVDQDCFSFKKPMVVPAKTFLSQIV